MPKRQADSTQEKAAKRRKLSADEVLAVVDAARNGDTTAVQEGLEKRTPDTESKKIVHKCLNVAVSHGHSETVRYLVGWKGVDVNLGDLDGVPMLVVAAREGHTAVVQVLLDAGADTEAMDGDPMFECPGRTALHVACEKGDLAIVKALVKAGADVCFTDDNGTTCFMQAAGYGHTETVRYLLGVPKVDVNHVLCESHDTALHFAAMEGRAEVVQVLIDAGAHIEAKNDIGHSPLFEASSGCEYRKIAREDEKLAIVKMLVKAGADVCVTNNVGFTCLIEALRFKHSEIVRYLVGLPEVNVNYVNPEPGIQVTRTGGQCFRTALHYAVLWSVPESVQVLIDAGADIEAKDEKGRRPLHYACEIEELASVQVLVEAGADVCATNDEGTTCLMLAAHSEHTETVRYLVGLPDVDVHAENDSCCTALHFAGIATDPEGAQLLIDAGADIEAKDDQGLTPLHYACEDGKLAVVKMLIKAGADVCATDDKGTTCLMSASGHGHTETVRYLLGFSVVDVHAETDNSCTALHFAAMVGYGEVAQVLIAAGADIEARTSEGRTPLHYACEKRKSDKGRFRRVYVPPPNIVRVLIDAGADIEAKDDIGMTPLFVASYHGMSMLVKMLVKAGADACGTDNTGTTCLTLAAGYGHTETVRYLVGLKGVDVNHVLAMALSGTSLFLAVEGGHLKVVQVLIAAGADVEARSSEGLTPLHTACAGGDIAIVKMLVKAGADVCATDKRGRTCLMQAAGWGHTETVRYLLGLPGVDVNQTAIDSCGAALHFAVINTQPEALQALIDAGADLETKTQDMHRCTPLLVACCKGILAIVKMLVQAGADVCATDDIGMTSLMRSAANGHTEIVRYLLGLPGVDVNHTIKVHINALNLASYAEHTAVVGVLLEHGAVHSTDSVPLQTCTATHPEQA